MKNYDKNTKMEGEKENDRNSKTFTRKERKTYRKNDQSGKRFSHFNKADQSFGENYIQSRPRVNDPAWYYLTELSGKAVGSIPFNVFAGQRLDLGLASGITDNSTQTIPGVLVLNYITAAGKSSSGASALNIMAKALYTYVRHQNSGHSNYESSDLAIYILAMDAVYSKYFELKRIYETAMTYDFANRNIPDLLLRAMGANADNIRANLAQFRYGLNILAAKISSLAVPSFFHLFKRHAIIASAILMDSDSMRGQFYIWRQHYMRKYVPTSENGGSLQIVQTAGSYNYDELLEQLEELIDPIISDEDMNIMSGDILKAYGKENCYILPEVDEAATANFIYDENLLAQVENACCEDPDLTSGTGINGMNITQEDNILKCNPIFRNSNILHKRIFNSHKDDPDWKDTLEWTRGMTMNGYFGSEIITYFDLYTRTYDNQGNSNISRYYFSTMLAPADVQSMKALVLLAAFDWHPIFYICSKDANNVITSYDGFYGDIKKFTVLSDSEVERLHDSAVMGELNASLVKASN